MMIIKFICYLYYFILYLNLITCEDTEMVMEIINNCRIYIQASTIGNGANQARKRLNSELDEILKERSARRKQTE